MVITWSFFVLELVKFQVASVQILFVVSIFYEATYGRTLSQPYKGDIDMHMQNFNIGYKNNNIILDT